MTELQSIANEIADMLKKHHPLYKDMVIPELADIFTRHGINREEFMGKSGFSDYFNQHKSANLR